MSNSSELLEKLKKMKENLVTSLLKPDIIQALKPEVTQELSQKIELIYQMLINLQLKDELRDIKNTTMVPSKDNLSLHEQLNRLKDIATTKMDGNVTLFLLYRPTIDFEYEKGISGQDFKTIGDTEWIADFEESTLKRDGTNPIVAVWVPEGNINDVPNAFSSENDQFGDLGTNTSKNKYRVMVSSGTYALYQELKKSNFNSLFVLSKSIKEKLTKSEQYTKLDPVLLRLGNTGNALSNYYNKDKAEQVISEGKLNPKDIDQIIDNKNQDLTRLLLNRNDLTPNQLERVVSDGQEFEKGHTRNRAEDAKKLYQMAFDDLMAHNSNYSDQLVKKGNASAIERLFKYSPDHANGQDIMHIITQRHDLDPSVMEEVFNHPKFDSGHGIELLKHADPAIINMGINHLNYKKKLDANVLTAAINHKNPEIVKNIASNPDIKLNNHQVMHLLHNSDNDVKAEVAGKASTPEATDYVINNLQNNPNHKKIFTNLISKGNLDWRDKEAQGSYSEQEMNKITDYALSKHPDLINTHEFWNHNINPETMKKIASSSISPDAKKGMFNKTEITPDVIQTLLNADKDPELMKYVAGSNKATPEQITQSWNQMNKKIKNHNGFGDFNDWINNPNTPKELINHFAENEKKYNLSNDASRRLYTNPKIDPSHLNKLLSDEKPERRAWVAQNPNASSEQIIHGIQDKDKEVRGAFLKRQDLQPSHLATALKDRAPSNRAEIAKHPNMTPELLHQLITKDKSEDVRKNAVQHPNVSEDTLKHALTSDASEGVRSSALRHPKTGPELVNLALANPTADHAMELVDKPDLTSNQITKLSEALKQRYDSLPKNKYETNRIQSDINDAIYKYMTNPNIDPTFKNQFLKTVNPHTLQYIVNGDPNVSPEILEHMYNINKNDMNNNGLNIILKHPNINKTHIVDEIVNNGTEGNKGFLVNKVNLNPEQQKTLASKTQSIDTLGALAEKKNLSPETAEIIHNRSYSFNKEGVHSNNQYMNLKLAQNPSSPQHLIEKLSEHEDPNIRWEIARNVSTPEHVIDKLLKDPDKGVSKTAGDTVATIRPDAYNASLEGAHEIHVHPATEKLKHLQGLVEEAGGSIPKSKLPQQYQHLGQLFDGKGNLTTQTIDKYLHELPKQKFNVSYDTYNSDLQTHDNGASGPQKVLQVNLTNDQVKELKDKGLYDTFRKLHDMSYRSGHPVKKHTLGWARIDESTPGHHHYDEFQSDLGQGTIRQIEQAKQSGEMNPEEADKYTNDLKGIMKTLSGPFKNINHAISGVAHETSRQQGIKSTSMDTLEDQAKQSGMNTDKNLPGHMIANYKQVPEEIGYSNKPKKEVMPNTEAPEPTVQFRKLVKSYGAFAFMKKYFGDK